MNNSFCVSFDKLEPAIIKELRKVHPNALPISTEWFLKGINGNDGQVVIWWAEAGDK